MKKITKKSVKNQQFFDFFCSIFVLFHKFLQFFNKNRAIECKWSLDYENIADSSLDSMDDMKRIKYSR